MPNSKLATLLKDYGISIENHDKLELLLDATKERGKTLVELADQINLILKAPIEYNPKAFKKAFKGRAKEILSEFIDTLNSWDKPLNTPPEYHAVLEKFVSNKGIGFGKIGQPLRVSLLGSMTGSGLDEIMAILGVEEVTKRVEKAISTLKE
jgi:glutamyl-tRNA synthetase